MVVILGVIVMLVWDYVLFPLVYLCMDLMIILYNLVSYYIFLWVAFIFFWDSLILILRYL